MVPNKALYGDFPPCQAVFVFDVNVLGFEFGGQSITQARQNW